MTGLQRAVWWTEYVLRGGSTKHLRGSVSKMPFYKYYLLDIIGLTVTVVIITFYLLVNVLLFIIFKLRKLIFTKEKLKQK